MSNYLAWIEMDTKMEIGIRVFELLVDEQLKTEQRGVFFFFTTKQFFSVWIVFKINSYNLLDIYVYE